MIRSINFIFLSMISFVSWAQQVVVGNSRSRLEVGGHALFGGENGTSVFGHTIGLNVYNDGLVKHMGTGYAGIMAFNSSTPSLDITIYPSNSVGALVSGGITGIRLGTPTGAKFLTSASLTNGALDVGRGNSVNGTAVFFGTTYNSHFNYSTEENTYIRGGKPGSRVFLNDVSGSDNRIGGTSSIVGVNYNNPVYTFEIRQTGGTGITMTYDVGVWEWRVAGTSFYLRYKNVNKGYFSSVDGSYNTLSDQRIKKDIEDIPSVLDKLMNLNPVDYEMKSGNPNHIRTTGFIAQQAQRYFPQLVDGNPDGKNQLSMNYSGLAPIVVKAIQEQQVLIDAEYKAQQEANGLLKKIEKAFTKEK